ncbi:hypothetical protein BDA96_04G200700 [Sorghum bicolor]|jgi:hypothetical protein|uniref:Uncharacterized protein n=1 Tax=Sorghum bicolor TaxID=4558 RepID=A0A921R6B8_SORBI|nr:hypothetical protein BDA96_04G200700 [Sorghum bicolor]
MTAARTSMSASPMTADIIMERKKPECAWYTYPTASCWLTKLEQGVLSAITEG